jgi:hypothetical protein
LTFRRTRGPKTDAAIRKRVDEILAQHHAEEWITVEVKWDAVEKFKAITRGKPTAETPFRRIIQQVPRLHISTNAANIARSAAMDGIFPLTTNTKEKPVDLFKIYKYQPRIEKRHALLKSTLEVAPIWLKKNARIEALMFLELIAQIIAALIERDLRKKWLKRKSSYSARCRKAEHPRHQPLNRFCASLRNKTKRALRRRSPDQTICRSPNAGAIANTSVARNTDHRLQSRQVAQPLNRGAQVVHHDGAECRVQGPREPGISRNKMYADTVEAHLAAHALQPHMPELQIGRVKVGPYRFGATRHSFHGGISQAGTSTRNSVPGN